MTAARPTPGAGWHAQQIAEFLAAVSAYETEPAALDGAVERAAEAMEAEVAAVVADGRVVASVGFRAGQVPVEAVVTAAGGGRSPAGAGPGGPPVLAVPGVGDCVTVTVPVDDISVLLVARSGEPFTSEEAVLLRGMGRVLGQALRSLRALAVVRERQTLLERLFRIQRSISHRLPINDVLDSITEGAAELLGDDTASLRVLDEHDPSRTVLLSTTGLDRSVMGTLQRATVDQGLSGQAIAEGHLVVAEDYAAFPRSHPALTAHGLRSAMAAPVSRNGEIVGSLLVGSHTPRTYSPAEQEVLLAFAEHASLALNDAAAVEGMRRAFDEAVHQATHDPLTGLPNRSLVLDRLDQALFRAERTGARVAVLFADLDRFKVINDSFGHSVGDGVLLTISERLLAAVRPHDTVGRLAGDEFVVVCEDLREEDAALVAARVAAAVSQPIMVGGRETVITASIGIAHAESGTRAEDILRDSDVAMYRAKERGRSRIELFDAEMRRRMLARLETERSLRSAITDGGLRLDYQPIVCFDDWRVVAAEALVRWDHPERGLVQPAEFIPLAEDSGLILALGQWVLEEACRQLAQWRAQGRAALRVTVNLSARQFGDPDLIAVVSRALDRAGLPADALWLEITESVLMEEVEATAETLRALKRLGVHLSVDDFGTGYSSLSYLKRFPVDLLKIDRSFVDGLGTDPDDGAIVLAIVSLAKALRLGVVAEGVEHPWQLEALRGLGCNAVQGYLLGRPGSPDSLPHRAGPPRLSAVG
ncbi:MAG TPA: EAL domain-containing protein [Acidimicrobiia bacterium]|nr:EAL domain-containing protein [Acidimicrobiia bacterium]